MKNMLNTNFANLVTHEAPMCRMFLGRTEGHTDTMRDNDDHLFGLVGQKCFTLIVKDFRENIFQQYANSNTSWQKTFVCYIHINNTLTSCSYV